MLDAIKTCARQLMCLLAAVSLFACGVAPASPPLPQPTTVFPSNISATAQTFSDPFAYCASIGTIDSPDAQYVGDKMPAVIVRGLRKALNAPAAAPDDFFIRGSFWRCMNGKVYACTVGANLPCESKANVDKNPTQAEIDFCAQNPNAGIPAAVTGHGTIFEWRCSNRVPEIVRQVFQVDARGFIAEIWYEISAN